VLVKKNSRATHGNKHVKSVITESAWAATRTKNTFYSEKYHRLAARRGKKRALIAVGHSILVSVYYILKYGCEYNELGEDYASQKNADKRKRYFKKELEKLGYEVELLFKEQEIVVI